MSYKEQFKHPNWQKKRLEVLQAANYKCQICFSTEKTLNVHHGHYRKDAKVWEYNLESLWCLCEDCHKTIHERMEVITSTIGQMSPDCIEQIENIITAIDQTQINAKHQQYLEGQKDG